MLLYRPQKLQAFGRRFRAWRPMVLYWLTVSADFARLRLIPAAGCNFKTFRDMQKFDFSALVGVVSVLVGVVVASFLFGGYGALIAGVLAAVGVADCASHTDNNSVTE